MLIYISKYALTKGIYEVQTKEGSRPGAIMYRLPGAYFDDYASPTLEGKEWHRTRDQAVKRAYEMKRNRMVSIARQMEKLKKMEFA